MGICVIKIHKGRQWSLAMSVWLMTSSSVTNFLGNLLSVSIVGAPVGICPTGAGKGSTCKNTGGRMIHGRIESYGYFVGLNRVKAMLAEIDPVGALTRKHNTIVKRREYYVKSPQSLNHIDACHHLINWKFNINGGIDGKSRFITYMSVENNNRALTLLNTFKESVRKYGLPSRVRGDCGVENVLVCEFMEMIRGSGWC
jgi:hypothetical protein